MKTQQILCLAMGLFLAIVSQKASAAWLFADSYAYFDAAGNVVGQSILTCNTANPRKASGTTSIYWRMDTTLCSNRAGIEGDLCYQQIENNTVIRWSCAPNVVTFQTKGVRSTRTDHLPPGLTTALSCAKVDCTLIEQQIIPDLQAGAHVAGSESLPPNASDCANMENGDCYAWLIQ